MASPFETQLDPRVRPRRWIDPEPVPLELEALHDDRLLHALLYRRGLRERAHVARFLQSDLRAEIDASRLPDLDAAVARISTAIRRDERIGIFGDYDVDGTASVAMLGLALRSAGAGERTFLRLPTRAEGYGLSGVAIEEFDDAGVTLLITLDCGSSDQGQVRYARSLGMDVVIVDHHQMHDDGPEGALIVSAYRPGAGDYRELSAAGLTWLLIDRLSDAGIQVALDEQGPDAYLDLAALGIIGDVSPMIGSARSIARAGMARISQDPRPGIAALATAAKVDVSRLGATDISFRLVPRLNAAGRMGNPGLALDLMLAPNPIAASALVAELEILNAGRRIATDQIAASAEQQMKLAPGGTERPIVVVQSPGWQAGVLGIVAARLVESYDRPALVLVEEDGVLRGSMRAPEGFDVAAALATCAPLLRSHGGHRLAGGLSLDAGQIDQLVEQLCALAADRTPAPSATLQLDAVLQQKHLDLETARKIRQLEPFGPGNEEPVFVLKNARLQKYDAMGQSRQHLSLTIGEGRSVRAAFFNAAPRSRELVGVRAIDLAFTLGESDWNGPKLDLHVKDFRVPE